MLETFALWLRATPFSTVIAENAWVIPAVQTVHIITVAMLMGSVIVVNLRLLNLIERRQPIVALMDHYLPVVGLCLVVLATTGAILISGEPTRALFRTTFWIKMALIVAVAAITWGCQVRVKRRAASGRGETTDILLRCGGVIALLLWVAVIVAGRWIGYTDGWPGSPS